MREPYTADHSWVAEAGQPLERLHRLEIAAEEGIHARSVDELLGREGIADEIGRGVLEVLLLFGSDLFADVGGEAGMPPGEELRHELGEMAWHSTSLARRRSRKRLVRRPPSHCGSGCQEPSAVLPPSLVSKWTGGCH
jgi:hypothetical protein